MISGGDGRRVTLDMPRGLFQERNADGVGLVQEFESPALGEYLKGEGVWDQVAIPFVQRLYSRTSSGGVLLDFGFFIDPNACAYSLWGEAKRLLESGHRGPLTRELVGAARFCLDASGIPAEEAMKIDEHLESIIAADQAIASGFTLAGLAGAEDPYVFEVGALTLLNGAKEGNVPSAVAELEKRIGMLRNQTYERLLGLHAQRGVQAAKGGNLRGAEASLAAIDLIHGYTYRFYSPQSPLRDLFEGEWRAQRQLVEQAMSEERKIASGSGPLALQN